MALLGLNSLIATGTNQSLSLSSTGSGVVNVPATLNITRYGNTHFQLGATYDTYLTYGSTGAVYLRTYNGTSYVNRFVIDANGRLTTGLVPWARLENVPTSLANTVNLTGNQTVAGIKTFSNNVIVTAANNTANGGGQLYLNGSGGNRIDFNTAGVAAPAFTTRSAGTKVVLYPGIGAAAADYALGIESSTLWQSVPTSSQQFRWYAGTTNIATLSGAGALTISNTLSLGAQASTISHAVRADRSISAGNGLTGGGNLTANRTLSVQVVSGGGISSASGGISVDSTVVRTSSLLAQIKTVGIGDGRLTADFSGSTGAANYMPTPGQFNDKAFTPIFTQDWPQTSTWAGILTTKGWSGTAYAAWQLAGTAHTSTVDEWYLRSGINTTWNTWRRVWHDGNITPVPTSRSISTGSGLSGGGNLTANRTLTVDSTVVRTSGNQTIGGVKTFSSAPVISATTGSLTFNDSGTTKRGVLGTVGGSDQWFVGGGATASNAGFMEIATGDDNGTEPIYVRQYQSGTPLTGTITRTLTLLDASGNSSFPGVVSLGTQATTASHAVRADRSISTGDGLSGGGDLTASRTLTVDNTVVRTSSNQIIPGIKTFSGGIIPGSTQGYPNYELLLDFGSDAAGTWRRIVNVVSPNIQFSSIGFKIEITDPKANHATPGSVNSVITETYYVACVRTEATTLGTPNACYVRGPGNRIRATRTATGVYEIHIQNEAQNREYRVNISVYAVNGVHNVSYQPGPANAGTAQYNASVSTTSAAVFQNISARSLTLTTQATTTSQAVRADRSITINGTTNQITSSVGAQNLTADRTWTLSLPQNIHTAATPTFAGGTFTGMTAFYSPVTTTQDDFQNSPITMRERGAAGAGTGADNQSPNINFHWNGRVSNSLWMGANGHLNWGSYSAQGVPAVDGTIKAATFSGALTGNVTGSVTGSTFSGDAVNKPIITTRTDSGFYEHDTAATGDGWPINGSWMHLLACTHSNKANYYSMQIAASFFNNTDLYYRSVNNSGTTAWSKIWNSANDGAGSGLDADLLDGVDSLTYSASLRANKNITGGGTITVNASGNVLWSSRFIVISNGRGAYFGTSGYFDINCPTSGTITGVGGAANKTATTAGIPLAAWEALYYILPIGSTNGSLAANFRVASYTANADIPHNWVLICVRNGDNGVFKFTNGITLRVSQSINTGTYDSRRANFADFADLLTTTRTIWGQNFNGSANVTGNLTAVGNITGSGAITITAGGTNQNITLTPSGTGTVNAPTFNATSIDAGGFQGIDTDTVTTPSFTWSGNLTTGIYRPDTNQVGITTNGTQAALWDANNNYRLIGSMGVGTAGISNANIIMNAANTFTQNGARRGISLTLTTSDQNLTANREQIGALVVTTSNQTTLFDSVNSVNRALTLRGAYAQAFNGTANNSDSVATTVIGSTGLARNRGRQTVANVYGLQGIVDTAGPLEVSNGVPQINNARTVDLSLRIRTGTTANAYGVYNYVRNGGVSTDNGTITNGYGMYALMQNSHGTYTRAFGVRTDFSGTIGQKIGYLTIGGANLDFAAQSTGNITIGHWNTNGTATARLTINTSGNSTFGGTVTAQDVTLGRGGGGISSNTAVGNGALAANTTGLNNTAFGQNALLSNTTGCFNTAFGNSALFSNTTASNNTASGVNALLSNTTGVNNTASGVSALRSNTTGANNTASGVNALFCNTTGSFNTASGSCALFSNTTGSSNTAFGSSALLSNTTGFSNTASGVNALLCNTTGSSNTAFGSSALRSNTTGANNTASGGDALCANTTGFNNTAFGSSALRCNTTGNGNTASGGGALQSNTTGAANTASGVNALLSNTTGCFNTAFGDSALLSNTTASNNTAFGVNALLSNTSNNNIAFGNSALSSTTTGFNNIGIGVNAGRTGGFPQGIVNITTQSNRIVMGNNDHTCAQIKIAWTATSDCRDKTCFAPIPHGLDFVRALNPMEYRFKEGGRDSEIAEEKRRYGFLAQDILPLEGNDPVIISADDPDKLQYTEAHLIPVLVKAIQELAQRVQELENA